jgi:hypothetical protein
MGVLKKKEERTETVTIRIASSVKAEIDQLRERAEATGFDLNANNVRVTDTIGQAGTGRARRDRNAQH